MSVICIREGESKKSNSWRSELGFKVLRMKINNKRTKQKEGVINEC